MCLLKYSRVNFATLHGARHSIGRAAAAPSINFSEPFEQNEKRFSHAEQRRKKNTGVGVNMPIASELKYTRGNFCGPAEFCLKRVETCDASAGAVGHGRAL